MKMNVTLTGILLPLLFLLSFASATAQPKYDFRNATRLSGSDRQVGALYRFPNVRAGVDALVSVTAITGGLTLNTLDGTSSGFAEAFQPVITAPAHSKGYVEFTITFVISGTFTAVVQTEIPITPIDVDGQANQVYEFDEIYRYNGNYIDYDLLGGELKMTYPSANWVVGTNTAGVDYGGVDTTARGVMFSVVNASTSTLVVRTGADNKSNSSQQRLRSLYFKKFTYSNSILSQPEIRSFWQDKKDKSTMSDDQRFKVYPTAFENKVTLKIKADKAGMATFRMVDYSGRLVKQQLVAIQKGDNNIIINDLGNIGSGSYIALLSMDDQIINRKLIKE